MRFFFRPPPAWPTVGAALALGVLVGESLFVIGPYMHDFRTGSFWPALLEALALYALVGVGLDLLVQLGFRARATLLLRGGVVLAAGIGLCLGAGEVRSLPLLALAALFAVIALGRFTWPLAVGLAVYALLPAWRVPPEVAVKPGGTTTAFARTAPADAPSFVIVVLDTLRRDHTSAYGYERDTTPHLARLASRGVRFERAYAAGQWSLPAHASLFTGLYPSRHGAHSENLYLAPSHPTVAEILGARGWETVSVSENAWIAPGTGTTRGFTTIHETWREFLVDLMLLGQRVRMALFATDRDKGGRASVDVVRSWLESRDGSRPYLLFVNVFEAHAPYQHVPREFRTRYTSPALSLHELERVGTRVSTSCENGNLLEPVDLTPSIDLMDGAIAAADHVLGQILELVGDEPVVVVVADHGEFMGEHRLHGHSVSLYEPIVHVPLVMAGGSLPRGVVIDKLVSQVDVMPTLLGLTGLPTSDLPPSDGVDVRPLWETEASLPRVAIRVEQFHKGEMGGFARHHGEEFGAYLLGRKQAVLSGPWKRIVSDTGRDEGFHLVRDPGEEHPVSGQETRLSAAVPEPGEASVPGSELDPVQRQALKLLGYLQ